MVFTYPHKPSTVATSMTNPMKLARFQAVKAKCVDKRFSKKTLASRPQTHNESLQTLYNRKFRTFFRTNKIFRLFYSKNIFGNLDISKKQAEFIDRLSTLTRRFDRAGSKCRVYSVPRFFCKFPLRKPRPGLYL